VETYNAKSLLGSIVRNYFLLRSSIVQGFAVISYLFPPMVEASRPHRLAIISTKR